MQQFTKEQRGILYPLVFFDLMSLPLAFYQIFLYQYETQLSLFEIEKKLLLDELLFASVKKSGDKIGLRNYTEEELQERELVNQKKWKKAEHIAKKIQWIPFIKMLAVINSVSFNSAYKESDIDFLFITEKNRLWIVRTFVTIWLGLLGLKKKKKAVVDKACLGFWVSDDNLNFEDLQILKGKDIYFLYWFGHITPLLDEKTAERFWLENSCIKQKLPMAKLKKDKILPISPVCEFLKGFVEVFFFGPIGNLIDKVLFWFHQKRLASFPENQVAKEPFVVIKKNILKLHPYDKRREKQENFEKKSKNILFKIYNQ